MPLDNVKPVTTSIAHLGFDIGKFSVYECAIPDAERAIAAKEGIPPHPKIFSPDQYGNNFPIGALSLPMINGERSVRDLAWSEQLQSLFFFHVDCSSSVKHVQKLWTSVHNSA